MSVYATAVYLTGAVLYMITQSWQIAVLTVTVAVIAFALRHRSAHVRYLLWLIVVLKCVVPPLHTAALRVLPGSAPEGLPAVLLQPPWSLDPASVMDLLGRPMPMQELGLPPSTPQADARHTVVVTVPRPWPVLWAVVSVWLIGAGLYLMMNLLRALRGRHWLQENRRPLPDDAHADAADLLRAYGVRRLPRIWIVEGVGQPFVWGLIRGSIYIPSCFLSIESREHRQAVLAHELSHVLRFDAAVNVLQVVAQGLFWFHPFVWWANRKIRQEREKCCDEMVIARLHTPPKDYSTAIVETLARAGKSDQSVPSLAVASPVKHIEGRIRAILRPGKRFHARPSLPVVTLVILAALAAVPTTLVVTALTLEPIALPVPLAEFPHVLNGWTGEDLEIPTTTQEYMRANFADGFISRRYMNEATRQSADLYVVCCSSRSREILRHRPLLCYPGNGWIWDQTVPSHILTSSNRMFLCVTHRFHRPPAQQIAVLCFYVADNEIMSDQDLSLRLARETDPPRYVAQVQISSTQEDSIHSVASAMADALVKTFAIRGPSVSIINGAEKQPATEDTNDEGESRQPGLRARTFNSQMTLDVFVKKTLSCIPDIDSGEIEMEPRWIGRTPTTPPLGIPAGWIWWVLPSVPVQDWSLLIGELNRNDVPGLKLPLATDSDMEHLADLPELKYLDLMSPQITDAGLAYLKGLTQLQWLNLYGAGVTNAGLAHLKDMAGLQILVLGHTQITDAGMVHFKGLTGLQGLSLQDNPITDAGLKDLKGLTKLQFLDLLGTQITDAGLIHLSDLGELQALLLGSNKITGSGLAYLKSMPRLRGLVLTGTQITDAGLVHLASLTGLQGLTLSGSQITDTGIVHLNGLTGLRVLELEHTQITDAGMAYLRGLTQLQWLDLTSDKITDSGLKQLKTLTTLEHINVRGVQITTAGVQQLERSLPNLTRD